MTNNRDGRHGLDFPMYSAVSQARNFPPGSHYKSFKEDGKPDPHSLFSSM